MKMLLMDTSTERGIVSLLEDSAILFHKELPFGFNNSQHLLPTIHEGLQHTKLTLQEINLLAVGVGPGSYTGIRVGASVAKTIAFACHQPLVGICSLEGFVPDRDARFAVMLDAKISGVYLLTGIRQGQEIHLTSQPAVCEIKQAQDLLRKIDVVVTPNSIRLKTLFPDATWEWQESAPSPTHMAAIALQKYHQGQFSSDGHLELLYLRKTQAELEKERMKDEG